MSVGSDTNTTDHTTNIAYVIDGRVPSNNGYVLQTVRMCKGFVRAGFDVTLTYPRKIQTNPDLVEVDIFEYFGIEDRFTIAALPYPDPEQCPAVVGDRLKRLATWVASLWFALLAAVRFRLRPADLHFTRNWLVAYAFTLAGLPTVFEIHKTAGLSFTPRGRRAIGGVADRDALRAVVTLTDPTADGLEEIGIPSEKILVEPDAVDLASYENSVDRSTARERLDLPTDCPIVGYTGSLFDGKGARILADACRDLDVLVLVVGGSRTDRESFRSYLDDRGIDNVRLIGRVPPPEVPLYQWAANVLVLPPTAAGSDRKHHPQATSPLKLFEYMAAQRPVVATRLPGIDDVLTHEETGLLVPPDNSRALGAAIEQLLGDGALATSLADNARSAVNAYTWRRRAERIAEFAL